MSPRSSARPVLPGNARFAFTIIDDTDVATIDNVAPMYALLHRSGLRTTKTVWPLDWHGEGSNFAGSTTLEDADYLAFVRELQAQGFEIASHGATMESSDRDTTMLALDRLREAFGDVPRVFANHSNNRENIYWGTARLDQPLLRAAYRAVLRKPDDFFQGHQPDSPYWWGDLCQQHHEYVRNLTFDDLNVLRWNPSMPYHDPSRPYVRWWYSAADAEDADEFVRFVTVENLDRLEAEGGVCILATHFGKGYVRDGRVLPAVQRIVEDLARRAGYYAPVGELLDCLRAQRGEDHVLPRREWSRMQWQWAAALVRRRLKAGRSPIRQ